MRRLLSGRSANLSRRTKAPNERRQPDLKVLDFATGILPLWALGNLVCSIPQIGKHCDNLLHLIYLKYFNGALDQWSFLPNGHYRVAARTSMRFAAGMSRHRCAALTLAPTVAQIHAHVVRVCKANGIEISYTREARADGQAPRGLD